MYTEHETHLSPVAIFMKSWRVYQDIIENNYMFHREITRAVSEEITHFKPNAAIKILDLGCGDASMAIPLREPELISSYLGCDLSKPALDIAGKALSEHHIANQLLCDDMLRVAMAQPDKSADLVISSYALHHLNKRQKEQIVQEISRILVPGGCFVLIDIFREPTEDRAAYMRNYMGRLRESWIQLTPESKEIVIDHATNYDFPETTRFFEMLCKKYSLAIGKPLAKHTWHEAWLFTNQKS